MHDFCLIIFHYFSARGTIQPGLRLVPSGNFFLALNRSHLFLLKKSLNIIRQVEPTDSNLITLYLFSVFFSNVKLSKLNHWAQVVLSNSDFFFTKNAEFYLKPKRNSRMAQVWVGILSPIPNVFIQVYRNFSSIDIEINNFSTSYYREQLK